MKYLYITEKLNQKRVAEGKPPIKHSFDIWHLAKNLGKKITMASITLSS